MEVIGVIAVIVALALVYMKRGSLKSSGANKNDDDDFIGGDDE